MTIQLTCPHCLQFVQAADGYSDCPLCGKCLAEGDISARFPTSRPNIKPHNGGLVLVLGILGIFIAPLGWLAWWIGRSDLKDMDAGSMDGSGRTSTQAGWFLGLLITVLTALCFGPFLLLWVIGLFLLPFVSSG